MENRGGRDDGGSGGEGDAKYFHICKSLQRSDQIPL